MVVDSFRILPSDCVDTYIAKKGWFASLLEALT